MIPRCHPKTLNQVTVFERTLRSAYTLAEMLIAMILVAALMSVTWAVMSMYNSLLTAGQSQTTEVSSFTVSDSGGGFFSCDVEVFRTVFNAVRR